MRRHHVDPRGSRPRTSVAAGGGRHRRDRGGRRCRPRRAAGGLRFGLRARRTNAAARRAGARVGWRPDAGHARRGQPRRTRPGRGHRADAPRHRAVRAARRRAGAARRAGDQPAPARHRRRPRWSAAGFRKDPHGAAAYEPGVPRQFFGELVFVHRARLAGEDLAGGVDGVGFHAAAAEGAERPFRLVAGQDQLGADDLRGAALGPDHRRHGERNPGRGQLLHAFERRQHFSWRAALRALHVARIYSNT